MELIRETVKTVFRLLERAYDRPSDFRETVKTVFRLLERAYDRPWDFTYPQIAFARPWPQPELWIKDSRGRWVEVHPNLDLRRKAATIDPQWHVLSGSDESALEGRLALLNAWRAGIPPEVLREANRYPCPYSLIKFLAAAGDPGLELSRSGCEVLCLSLAQTWQCWRGDRGRWREAISLAVRAPRPEIAGWLGYPARPATVRILRKAHLFSAQYPLKFLIALRKVMSDSSAFKKLCHLPAVNEAVVDVLAGEAGEAASVNFLRELLPLGQPEAPEAHETPEAYRPMSAWMEALCALDDALRMRAEMEPPPPLPPLRRLEDAERFHDAMLERYLDIKCASKARRRRFPPPPVEGSDQIVPIATRKDLVREGRECHHCVGLYAEEVAQGEAYFYRVLAPERATLLIRRAGALWHLAEIKAPCNRPVRGETLEAVEEWLDRTQHRLPEPVSSALSRAAYRKVE